MEELGKKTVGHGEYIADRMKGAELQLSAPLSVIASPEHIEALRSSSGAEWLADANYIPVGPGEAIPEHQLGQSGIVLFEVDPAIPASMDRIRHLHRSRPGMPQIVAMRDVDLKLVRTLVREGVADVVELPFSAEEILQTVVAVLETHREATVSEVRLAPLIAVRGRWAAPARRRSLAIWLPTWPGASDGQRSAFSISISSSADWLKCWA